MSDSPSNERKLLYRCQQLLTALHWCRPNCQDCDIAQLLKELEALELKP